MVCIYTFQATSAIGERSKLQADLESTQAALKAKGSGKVCYNYLEYYYPFLYVLGILLSGAQLEPGTSYMAMCVTFDDTGKPLFNEPLYNKVLIIL